MAPRPRGRPRQGSGRIDAALDYVSGQLGFAERTVRETVTELLNVYGGNVGWPFIEENSYTVLVEAMLAKQQSPAKMFPSAFSAINAVNSLKRTEMVYIPLTGAIKKLNLLDQKFREKEDHFQENRGRVRDTESSSAATPVTRLTEASSSNPAQASDALDSASQTNDVEEPYSLGYVESDGKDSILPDHGESFRPDRSNPVESSSVGPTMIQTSQPAQSFPIRRRKPCYGWISDDDHDDDDLVHLPPAPLPEELEKLFRQKTASGFVHSTLAPLPKGPEKLPDQSDTSRSGKKQRRRKSRWDEKPEDS